jgi:signal transduction histidine kinase
VRRRGTVRKSSKRLHRKPTRPKSNAASTTARRRSSSPADLQEQVIFIARELAESREQQAATAEILRAIAGSPTDLERVFAVVAASATRLCDASDATIHQVDGAVLRQVAHHGPVPVPGLLPMTRGVLAGRAVLDRQTIQVADLQAETVEYPEGSSIARRLGLHTNLAVPLIHTGKAIGVIIVRRTEVCPFTDRQIDLLRTFATQAVIALENTRLFEAEQQRTHELTESLRQQTAMADVLKVISRSTFDLQAVLHTLVETAARLCDADKATIARQQGGVFVRMEAYGVSPEFIEYARTVPVGPDRGSAIGRALLERKVIHIPDVQADPEYSWAEAQRFGSFRTNLGVPMLRDGVPIGAFGLTRSEMRPFTDKQIELVTTFADQAVIAIENARLFDEIQQKSKQLAEASQHKSQFLANMSHELRTPLNAILGYTELILDSVYGDMPEKARAVLDRVQRNGRHLLGLINEVLDLSKIEAGQLVLALADYSLKNVVETVYTAVEQLAKEKKISFTMDVAPDLPGGQGDERRLTQVLLNLAGNAIKFTDQGGVAIKASAANGSFEVAVRDTGPGIAAADQAKLFQEFQQADSSIARKKGGTGLGLAISKRIIEMHGGRIWVESTVGQGSTFCFVLPIIVKQQAKPT